MSKASEWADSAKSILDTVPPSPERVFNDITFGVAADGRLFLCLLSDARPVRGSTRTFDGAVALDLARWILDTFGEPAINRAL